jgi:predicted lipoprotein with Yx(FWY)xxD motif
MSRTTTLVALTAAAIALSACSSVSEAPVPVTSGPSAPVTQLERPRGTIVSANSTAKLGTVVVDGLGYTLYRFDGDTAQPPAATCAGPCTETWEPVPASDPIRVEGVKEEAVGSVQRPDGEVQLTLAGWPVYRHSGEAPGATDGHGADGKWFAIAPDGDKAAAPKR